jgi:flagellar hook assembly protein FlgD
MDIAGNGNVVSVVIFDEAGNVVNKLVSGMLCGPESAFIWDATADDGTPVRSGIDIVYISMYNSTGKTGKWKMACTVLRRR